MNPGKVSRNQLTTLTDLPNIGPASAGDLRLLGIEKPADLIGKDAFSLYRRLCDLTGSRQDPCVLDVLISVTAFMAGDNAKPWWAFTAERKQRYPDI
ncbi:helix-hairpin-helix domain-containing protein [Gallaecimonas mangrovi]|uniref:helix-hairpin-helix domain-containing protein n=1 Tax=Gallaecimonas mangrovi TaxID=2291597 RepID=UPI000E204891|nr:helix-hairpin-helix domain-containing protein [Gallaecimonas mangrovi]